MNWLKTKTWMIRIISEGVVCTAGLTLDFYGQFGKHFPECRSSMRGHNFSGSSFSVRPVSCSVNA